MSLQQECDALQSELSKALKFLTEAKTSADKLSDCSFDEIAGLIASILDICHEGVSSLEASQEQIIELLRYLTGNSQERKPSEAKSEEKNAELELAFAGFIDSAIDFARQVQDWPKELQEKGRKGVAGTMMFTGMCASVFTPMYKEMYKDVLDVIDLVNELVVTPTGEKSVLWRNRDTLEKGLESAGITSEWKKLLENEERLREERKPAGKEEKDEEEEEKKKRKKK